MGQWQQLHWNLQCNKALKSLQSAKDFLFNIKNTTASKQEPQIVRLHPVPTCDRCIIMFIPVMRKVWIDYKLQNDKHTLINLNIKKSVTFNF
jgi:hypothetical protein